MMCLGKSTLVAAAAAVLGVGSLAAPALGQRIDWSVEVRIGDDREPRKVWVEPVYRIERQRVWIEPEYRTQCERVWVEPIIEIRCEQVWMPERWETREVRYRDICGRVVVRREQVLIAPGHWTTVSTPVVVREGYWHDVERRVLVRAGHWKVVERRVVVREGHWRSRYDRGDIHIGVDNDGRYADDRERRRWERESARREDSRRDRDDWEREDRSDDRRDVDRRRDDDRREYFARDDRADRGERYR